MCLFDFPPFFCVNVSIYISEVPPQHFLSHSSYSSASSFMSFMFHTSFLLIFFLCCNTNLIHNTEIKHIGSVLTVSDMLWYLPHNQGTHLCIFFFELSEVLCAVFLFLCTGSLVAFHNKAQYRIKEHAMNKTLSPCTTALCTGGGWAELVEMT